MKYFNKQSEKNECSFVELKDASKKEKIRYKKSELKIARFILKEH